MRRKLTCATMRALNTTFLRALSQVQLSSWVKLIDAAERLYNEENKKGGSCPAAFWLELYHWLPSLLHCRCICASSPTTLAFTLAQTFWLSFRHAPTRLDLLGNHCSDWSWPLSPGLTLAHHSVPWLLVVMVTCLVTTWGSQPTFTGGAVRSSCPTASPA